MKTPFALAASAFFILHFSSFIAAAAEAAAAEPPAAAAQEGVQLWEGGPVWADRNVGADEPWERGLHFWWGDTVGYKRENDAWVANDGSSTNFSFAKEVDYIPTFKKNAAMARKEGWTTEENRLAPEHDAARVHWGGEWRMPTRQELIDLCYNKCDWTKVETNGVKGCLVRGRGDFASAAIFLPFTGMADYTKLISPDRFGGLYASDPRMDAVPGVWRLTYGRDFCVFYHWDRFMGMSVRPVRGDPGPFVRHGWAAGLENPEAEIKPAGPACAPDEVLAPAAGEPAAQKGVRLWEGGPLWADRNVGAETPSDYGWFFNWGGTLGATYNQEIRHWAAVDGSNPRFGFDDSQAPSFGKNTEVLRDEGYITEEGVLTPEHDPARVHWGEPWRMPTRHELDGLLSNCDWTWTTNGVKGCVVRGRGDYASAAIFLPVAGYSVEEKWWGKGTTGHLYASEPYTEGPNADCSWRLHFGAKGMGMDYCWDRHMAMPVRPVRE